MIENRADSYQLNDFLMHYITIIVLTFEEHSFPFIPVSSLCLAMAQNDKDSSLAFLHRNGSPFIL